MCSYCPTIVKDNISSLLYSVDKYSNRTYTNDYTYKYNDMCSAYREYMFVVLTMYCVDYITHHITGEVTIIWITHNTKYYTHTRNNKNFLCKVQC